MFAITGMIRHGLGLAAPSLEVQLPLIAREFPEVGACHPGSINVEFALPFLVLGPDHRTRPIVWSLSETRPEVVDLLRVDLEAPPGAAAVRAWLYLPHKSPHRATPRIHEIIAPRLDLAGVSQCRITVHRPALQLPWQAFPAVVIL